MNPAVNELVKSVVEKNSLEECSIEELQHLVSQFPYFGPAQFLLAQKLKQQNSPLYTQQSQKAILYFQDHLWFDYLSNDESTGIVSPVKQEEYVPSMPVHVKIEESEQQQEVETANTPSVADEVIDQPETLAHDAFMVEAETETEMEELKEELSEVSEEESPAIDEPSDNGATIIEEKQTHVEATPPQQDNEEEFVAPFVAESIHDNKIGDEQPEPQTEGPLPGFAGLKIEQTSIKTQELTFEPYHTVDYFASQGIRFKEEEKPKDRFGQQLKSFTEWLKTIKKAPETVPANGKQPVPEDRKVNQMAETSITDREVVTEAMADVWEKQGNYPKAIEIYRKLSLLNPSKSSYFAAKIEHLKHS